MNNTPEEHIEAPSKSGSRDQKRAYGRELAIESLMFAMAEENVERDVAHIECKIIQMPAPDRTPKHIKAVVGAIAAVFILSMMTIGFLRSPSSLQEEQNKFVVVKSIKGEVSFWDSEGKRISGELSNALAPGMRIETGSSSELKLEHEDGSLLTLGSDTQLANQTADNSDSLDGLLLTQGSVSISATPRNEENALVITSPNAIASVIGTEFTLSATQTITKLTVTEGLVRFAPHGETIAPYYIPAGRTAEIQSNTKGDYTVSVDGPPVITSFSLIDVATGRALPDYRVIEDGAEISISSLPQAGVSVRANMIGESNGVRFTGGGPNKISFKNREKEAPYTIAGDSLGIGGSVMPMRVALGEYTIDASLRSKKNKDAPNLTVSFSFVE